MEKKSYAIDDFPKFFWEAMDNNFSNFTQIRYLSALVSEMAYHEVLCEELGKHRRLRVIPCEGFKKIISSKRSTSMSRVFEGGDFREVQTNIDVVSTASTKVILFRFYGHMFISIRGTVPSYANDWKSNFKSRMMGIITYERKLSPMMVHEGFLREAMALFDLLCAKLHNSKPKLLFVTGHSLGGAVATLLSIFLSLSSIRPYSTVVFGSPRVGNWDMNHNLCQLFSSGSFSFVSNDKDMVQTVPWKSRGYVDFPNRIDAFGRIHLPSDSCIGPLQETWAWLRFLWSGFEAHKIEYYRRDCKLAATGQYDARRFCDLKKIVL